MGETQTAPNSAVVERIDLDAATSFNVHELRSIIRQRWVMLTVVGSLFIVLNGAVLYLIYHALSIDTTFVSAHPDLADKRVVTSGVFDALIAATVAQTGAVTWAMARFLFPR